jgi:hypothetical protein
MIITLQADARDSIARSGTQRGAFLLGPYNLTLSESALKVVASQPPEASPSNHEPGFGL